jgi:DNA-binding NarL/FixJ family response regulator
MRVLVCDRLSIVRHGLSALLEQEADIEMIATTGSGIEAMVLTRRRRPHVVVTGLDLDGMSGLELVRRLNQETIEPQPRFVVLSMLENEDIMSTVLHAGVHGLLAKEVTREQLGSAVRAAANGGMTLAPQVATRLVDWFCRQEPLIEGSAHPGLESLTAREREVLTILAQGLSIEEAAAELFIGCTTVRTHIYRLRTKLGLKDRAQLISFAYQGGLIPHGGGRQANERLPLNESLAFPALGHGRPHCSSFRNQIPSASHTSVTTAAGVIPASFSRYR